MLNHGNFNAGLMEGIKEKICEIYAAPRAFKCSVGKDTEL